ncbi:MAG: IPTL-CTERM sorting domain-containing protein [Acidobacteriota bacterium]
MPLHTSRRAQIFTIALAGLLLMAMPVLAQGKGEPDPADRTPVPFLGGGPADAFGHLIFDTSSGFCASNFIDISATGTPLTFTASGIFAADDDGGAALTLAAPFNFYGTDVTDVVVSTNGYVALGTTGGLADEDGGDFNEDCPLPATPSNDFFTEARVMPFHNDLAGDGTGGSVFVEYFASCPRTSEAGEEDCTIVMWDDWGLFGATGSYDLQAILYHQSGLMTYQYDDPGGLLDPTTAAVAIQNADATDAATYSCAAAATIDGNAVCIYTPTCSEPDCLGGGLGNNPFDPNIPTNSPVGLAVLAGLLGFFGLWLVRRR